MSCPNNAEKVSGCYAKPVLYDSEGMLIKNSGKVCETKFVATFQKNTKTADGWESNPADQIKLEFELIHPEKSEKEIWDDAISLAWIRLKDKHKSEHWQLVEVFAWIGDNNCLIQCAVKQPSRPRGTFDTWRDLTYAEMFNCEPLRYVK